MDESNELDRDVDDAMRLFERAHVGSASPITPIRPSRILLVLDGSEQDETSIASAVHLQKTYSTETLILDAREQLETQSGVVMGKSEIATKVVSQISNSRAIDRPSGDAFDAILAAIQQHQFSMVILPCPFGRSFETVGQDSAGTVMDVMLSRCSIPILITRRVDQSLQQCVQRVCVLSGGECDVETRAAGWAFGIAAPDSEVSLNLVVEKEHFENVRAIVEALRPGETFDESMLSDVLTQTHQSLHSAMNATAKQVGLKYHLIPQAGQTAPPNPLSDPTHQLLVLPLEVDDRFTQGFVQDRIRRSPHPVLVVPGHVS